MPRFTSLPRPVLLALAVLLAAAMLLHSALWMYYIRWQPRIYLGIRYGQLPQAEALGIAGVAPKSPAAEAGLQAGDRILSINGRPTNTLFPYHDVLRHGSAEDPVRVIVERPDDRGPHVFPLELHPSPVVTAKLTWLDFFSRQLITSFPLWFLIVSLPVLFMRLRDRNAWLMTLLFAGTIAGGPVLFLEPFMEPHLDHFAAAFKIIFAGTWGPLFNYFFSVFPVRSFLDRRLPWLKTVYLATALLVAVPLAAWALFSSGSQPLWRLAGAFGPHLSVVGLVFADFLLPIALGSISLIGNGFFSESREVQRKIRVIVWGTLAGLLPGLLVYSVPAYLGAGTQYFPFWLWAAPPLRQLRPQSPASFRLNGALERLESTTTIIGAFSKWDCPIREISLQAGDVLLIYTDGITEATNRAGEEFGDQRLASLLRELRGQSAEATLESVFAAVQQYTAGEQSDDLTLVVIRGL